jgi:predicted transcriptional regulator
MSQYIYTNEMYVMETEVSDLQFQILKILDREGPLSRYALMNLLERSSSTVHENLVKLVTMNLIQEQLSYTDKKGRPQYIFKLKL